MTLLGALDNFYLTKDQQEASPSRRDGISADEERELRHYCCDVVAEAAVLLRLPQVVAATAQVLVQRFYCKRSLRKFDPKVGAARGCWGAGVAAATSTHLARFSLLCSLTPPWPPTLTGGGHGRLLAGRQVGGGDPD